MPVSRYFLNPAARTNGSRGLFTAERYARVRDFYTSCLDAPPTPLHSLRSMSAKLGIADLMVKDEATRFGLNAFKILGVRYAVARLKDAGSLPANATLVCASAGNHGRAVARAARENGLQAKVYMSHTAAPARVQAIQGEGAETVLVNGTYDEAVRRSAADAQREGWLIVSDTAWEGYEQIPRWIMAGYTWMLDECARQWREAPTMVIVQAGVGGLAGAVASWFAFHYGEKRPFLAVVEPDNAACIMESVRAGHAARLGGNVDSSMTGLACGEPSSITWQVLAACADAFVTVDDAAAAEAMRALAKPTGEDPKITAGASGASGVAALMQITRNPAMAKLREAADLSASSRVLVFNTEGATDPEHYARTTQAPE